MLDSAVRLRTQARQFTNRRKPTATRYSAAFRTEVVSVARARIAEGVAVARIARDPRPALSGSEFRPVVVTPSGIRIEGLDLDGLVRVVRSLA